MEQTRVLEEVPVPLLVVLVVVPDVEEAVLAVVEAAALAVVDELVVVVDEAAEVVVVAVVLAGVVVEDDAVLSEVEVVSVARFLKSSFITSSTGPCRSLHSYENHTADTVESIASHPPAIKHCSIWSNRLKSTSSARHLTIDRSSPHEFLITKSWKFPCIQPSDFEVS